MKANLLSIPDLFRTAWERYTRGLTTYLKISVPFAFLIVVLMAIKPKTFSDNMLFGVIYFVIEIAVIIWFSSVLSLSTLYAVTDDAKSSVASYYEKGRAQWQRYFLTKLLQGLMVIAGFILFIIPGFILLTQFVVAEWVAIFESMRPRDALRQSKFYVKGRAWGVFGRFLLIALSGVPLQIISTEINNPVANFVLLALLMPWSAVCMYVLYTDLVRTKEVEVSTTPA